MQGKRYQSNDSQFHTWDNMGTFNGQSEHGGQWRIPFPAQVRWVVRGVVVQWVVRGVVQ